MSLNNLPPQQTIYVESVSQACKLVERLCRAGYYSTCQMSRPFPGRWITFSTSIDFRRNNRLFNGITFSVTMIPTDETAA